MKKQTNIAKIPLWAIGARMAADLILRLFFPRSIVDDKKILARVDQEAKNGSGLLIVFTHFSYRDPIDLLHSLVPTSSILKNKKIITPISFHQYNKFIANATDFLYTRLSPVVNQDTLNRKGFTHLNKGEGLSRFVEQSAKVVSEGGIVGLAVNAGRREKLDFEDKQRPIGYFIAAMQGKGISKYGILLVSVGMQGAKNYKKKEVGGLNLWKRYEFRIASYYRLEELLAQPEINGKLGNVDHFVRKKLAEVSPKEYLPDDYKPS